MIGRSQRRSFVRPVEVAIPYGLVVVALVASGALVPGFLSSGHLDSLTQTASYLGVIGIGQTFVLLLGGIDLSIPYNLNLAAALLTGLDASGLAGAGSTTLVLAVGLGVGLVNGLGVAVLGISPLVMTLGMNSVLQGVTLLYTGGTPVGTAPGFVTTLSTGLFGIPNSVILWIVLIVAVTFVLAATKLGRRIYAVGASVRASELSGLPVKRTVVTAYGLSGLAAALGGVLLAGYSGQAYLGMGDGYLLPSIAIVVIGGTSIFGGKGSYVQTVAGALLITIIESALLTIGVDQPGQDILYGAVILVMAYANQIAVAGDARSTAVTGRLRAIRGWLEPVANR